MNFKVIYPPARLANYVRFFWYTEGDASLHKPFAHRAFAYTCPELLFWYKGQFSYQAGLEPEKALAPGIYGQTQTFSKVAATAEFGIFGLYLYPHALPQLFGLPANEITNQSAAIKTLCGREGEILEENILSASNNNERVKLVTDFLEARLKNVKAEYANILFSISAISSTRQVASIKSLAADHFLSLRQFERRFKEFYGFPPKLFFRIARFNSLLNKTFQSIPLTQIAYEYGYYDQSHFIHDFQQFSGCNPKDYYKEETIAASDRGTVEF